MDFSIFGFEDEGWNFLDLQSDLNVLTHRKYLERQLKI